MFCVLKRKREREQVRVGSWERWRERVQGKRRQEKGGETESQEIRDVQVVLGPASWLEWEAPSPCSLASAFSGFWRMERYMGPSQALVLLSS